MSATTAVVADREAAWHAWRDRRWETASGPHGLAALVTTTWLDDPTPVPGLPGTWAPSRDGAVGSIDGEPVTVEPGTDVSTGDLLLRALVREGRLGIRVLDPAAPSRASLRGIETHPFDPAWVLDARWAPGAGTTDVEHVDGITTTDPVAGTLTVDLPSGAVELVAFPAAPGTVQVVFADPAHPEFRFVTVEVPAGPGVTEIDLNRSYLPPCTFTDHYLCPLPPASNRLSHEVPAGERGLSLR